MPDTNVWKLDRRLEGDLFAHNIVMDVHPQQVFHVLWRTTQPILVAEHEVAGILRFFYGQIFKNLR